MVRRPLAAHDRLVVRDDEAAAAQQRRQHRVELEAVAAAPVLQQPRAASAASSSGPVSPSCDREVLVRDARQIRAVQRVQAVDGRRGPGGEPDPGQQRVDHLGSSRNVNPSAASRVSVSARLMSAEFEHLRECRTAP